MSWFARFCREKFLEQKRQHFHDFVFPTFSNWISPQEFWLHCSDLHHNQLCSNFDHGFTMYIACITCIHKYPVEHGWDWYPSALQKHFKLFSFFDFTDEELGNALRPIFGRLNDYPEGPEKEMGARIFSPNFWEFNIFVQVLGTSYFWASLKN